jgi:surfeit locus 1 family protein
MTFSRNKANRKFQPGWALTLFFTVFFVLTVGLGIWQTNRAAWKTQLMNEFDVRATATPESPLRNMKPYTHVLIEGRPETIDSLYWDNRTYDGRAGYEILVPVRLTEGDYDLALVNLGWVQGEADRSRLPEMPGLPAHVTWRGVLRPLDQNWGIGLMNEQRVVDYPVLSKVFSRQINWLPYLIELDEAEPYALERNWQPSVMPPEKHQAYAVQWFSMAVALVVMYIIVGRRSARSSFSDDTK